MASLFSFVLPTQAKDKRQWSGLHGSALALAITEAAQQHNGPLVIITSDNNEAYQLEQSLQFFNQDSDIPILLFPDWETLPYDLFSPHQDITSQRLSALAAIPHLTKAIVLVAMTTAMHRLCPRSYLDGNSFSIKTGDKLDIHTLRSRLEHTGYRHGDTVYEHGEFTVRGAIVDLFPMGSNAPLRIELFDDEVDTLRTFDPETQRSIEKIDVFSLLPANEFPMDPQGIAQFQNSFIDQFDVDYRKCPIYQDIKEGLSSAGIEYFLPLFFKQTSTLFDYLPSNSLIVNMPGSHEQLTTFWKDIEDRYEARRYDITRPLLTPSTVFVPENQLFEAINQFARIDIQTSNASDSSSHFHFETQKPPELTINAKLQSPLTSVIRFINDAQETGKRVLFCAESAGRRETLLDLLQPVHIQPSIVENWQHFLSDDSIDIGITIAPLDEGLHCPVESITLIAESQLFGQRVLQRRRREKDQAVAADAVIKNLTELKIGAPVVHIDSGVGRYIGLQTLDIDKQPYEFVTLEYAGGDKLYVPVSSLHMISRYTGSSEDNAPLHRLGAEQWQRAKKKAAEKIHDVAAELLNIYARRAAKVGHQFSLDKSDYELFAHGFPFEETPDQKLAINAAINDMLSPRPMDRLICGDVGFGKTEVAMRAAFVAVQGEKQVGILVPTTLLAQQHYETIKDRFADWPITVEVLSRFKSTKEINGALEKIASGKVDIVVGTHKLLQPSVKFKNLGLLIIDEEHRFGVKHKEKLKSLRAEVDMLTLTATPIPRTLNMAMAGIRDMSIIATPPAKRLSIKTFVQQSSDNVIKEAVLRELLRGGQVYYLHNEVKSIEKTARELSELIPEARIAIAHGQMRERELESVMSDFYHKRFNVLVCTTIIETGIDVPSANTIIMDRADRLGLAQMHQLRGRVGRSHHQAYAYLLTPHKKQMTSDAKKRLEAIQSANDLGAGFSLASHDLEIRGAGELLGEEQSGNLHTIGFSLYMEMLERAVESIKNGETPNLDKPLMIGADINLHIPAIIPEEYLPDVHNRLIMYKRISSSKDDNALKEIKIEMIDRFGLLPEQVKLLFRVTELRLFADKVGIDKIEAGAEKGKITFSSSTKVQPLSLVKLVQTQPQLYQLEGADKLRFSLEMETPEERLNEINGLIDTLIA